MTILIESFAGYRRITLNRPERLNALTVEMAAALNAALDEAEGDKDCRALLLTGAGRAFCAGQDLTDRRCDAGRSGTSAGPFPSAGPETAGAADPGGLCGQRRRRRGRGQSR